MQYVNLKYTTL